MKTLLAALALLWLIATPVAAAPAALPADSLYRLPAMTLVDQTGTRQPLTALAGHPYLIGMFYGSCHEVCPLEIERIKALQQRLARQRAGSIRVLLVSFDPEHDTVGQLQHLADMHRLQAPGFRLARLDSGDTGMLGGVLGISWRALPEGGFSHNARISLVDATGRIVAQQDAQRLNDPDFMRALRARIAQEPAR